MKIIFSRIFFRWKFSDKIFVFGRKFSLLMIFPLFIIFFLESLKWWFFVWFCEVFLRMKILEVDTGNFVNFFVILKFLYEKFNQFIWRKFLRVMMDFFNGFSVSRKIMMFSFYIFTLKNHLIILSLCLNFKKLEQKSLKYFFLILEIILDIVGKI